jgi:hypothetical protein
LTSIGPGPESVTISIYASGGDSGRWDHSTWDGGLWGSPSWQSVGCDVGEATYKWGASDEAGVLSVAAAGEIDVQTIDPDRVLDPLNASSPYYGAIRPGTPLRISGVGSTGEILAATGFIDEASHELSTSTGRIRAVDGLAYLAQAKVPDGTVLPNTLRARVRAVVTACGLGSLVPVEAESIDNPDVDPPVAPFDGKGAPAWQIIANAAQDALVYVWVGPSGTLRFRSWGAFPDAALSIGCPPDDADPADEWIEGLSALASLASAESIRNTLRDYSSGTTWSAPVSDSISVAKYGPRPMDVDRVIPDFPTWSSRVLADRADAGLMIDVGQVRPYTLGELEALLGQTLAGPSVVRVRDDAHGDVVDLDVGWIGATVGITPQGWRFALTTMISRVDWESIDPTPPEPPIPPPNPFHTETRTYIASSDALIALTSGGSKYGAGASNSLPIGVWQGWQYRGLLKFPSIPWTKVKRVVSATLDVQTTTQVRIGFGSSPKTQIRRITGSWSAGSSSSPSGSNAVVWPGPQTTGSNAVTSSLPSGQNASKSIRVDALVRAWAPASIGGSGAVQQGLALYEASGSGSNTSEVWPVEQGGGARPQITLVVEVYD